MFEFWVRVGVRVKVRANIRLLGYKTPGTKRLSTKRLGYEMSESPHSNQWDSWAHRWTSLGSLGIPLGFCGIPIWYHPKKRETPRFLVVFHWLLSNKTFCKGRSRWTYGIRRTHLRSATHGDLLVPRTRTVTYGPRSCAVSTVSGMTCHRPCVHYPAHSDSFKAHWKQHCFVQHIRKMIWHFRDCLGRHNSAI